MTNSESGNPGHPQESADCIYLSTGVSPSPYALNAREQANRIRKHLSQKTSNKSLKRCNTTFQVVKLRAGIREPLEVKDFCGNKHICPSCMGYLYSRFRNQLLALLDWWCDERGSVYTQTLTLPNRNRSLVTKHEHLAKTWNCLCKSKIFTRIKEQFGVEQYLRVLEDSLKIVGSNPHYHLTWFFNPTAGNDHMQGFAEEIGALWEECSKKLGIRGTLASQQWAGPIRESNTAYSNYMAKHGYLDSSFDPKKPVGLHQGLKPLDFLRVMLQSGDKAMYNLFEEYKQATYRRHRIQPSRGFLWAPKSNANQLP